MMSIRWFLIFSILLAAILAVLGVLGVVSWDDLSNHGGKLLLAMVILFGAGFVMSQIGPKNQKKSSQDGSPKQGPQF